MMASFLVQIDNLEEDVPLGDVEEVVHTVVQQAYPFNDVTIENAEDL